MNSGGGNAWQASLITLWRRAPWWRLFALLAPFLTMLFLLFPPEGRTQSTVSNSPAKDRASYVPQVAPARSAPSSPQFSPPPGATSTQPRMAQLSLATDGPTSPPNGTGLADAMIGPLYTGRINFEGFTVPLPEGHWIVLAANRASTPTATGRAHYLGRVENRRLTGMVKLIVLRSQVQPGHGFPEVKDCIQPPNPRLSIFVEGTPVPTEHQSCWIVRNYFASILQYWADRGKQMPNLERAAAGDLAAKGVTYPQDFVDITFMISNKSAYLGISYILNPETEGINSSQALSLWDSDWTSAHIGRFPEKLAYVAKLKVWANSFWPNIKDAFVKGTVSEAP